MPFVEHESIQPPEKRSKKRKCPRCKGSRTIPDGKTFKTCPRCEGEGTVIVK